MGYIRAAFTLSALALAAAQDLNRTIVGCVEVECPGSSTDNVNDNCTVGDTGSFDSIGLARVPTAGPDNTNTNADDASALAGLSWTKGFNNTLRDGGDGAGTFHNSFYLGTPSGLELNASTGACAVFLHGASGAISFPGDSPVQLAEGTCADAMGGSCVDALISRASGLIQGYNNAGGDKPSISDVCGRLQRDLEDSNDVACAQISKGTWSNFTSAALTGDGAPQAFSQQQKSSSSCWPIVPKQDDLTLVSEYHTPGSQYAGDMQTAEFAITPILTVFYPADDGSLVSNVDASLTCVKVMGPPRASLSTFNNGSDDTGGASTLSSSSFSLFSASLATAFVVFALYAA